MSDDKRVPVFPLLETAVALDPEHPDQAILRLTTTNGTLRVAVPRTGLKALRDQFDEAIRLTAPQKRKH